MAQAQNGDTVAVHYTGTLTDGSVFDSSREREPLSFTVGSGQVIAGFDKAVMGLAPGESRSATIPAAEAYGEHRDDLVFEVGREQLPENLEPELGDQFEMRQPDGTPMLVTVVALDEDVVVFDANHPLAGMDLTFDIELVEIK